MLSGWASAHAGGSIGRAPVAVLIMAAGLGVTGLMVGAMIGRYRRAIWWTPLVLLGSFYTGTWLGSPHHSPAGDTIVLVLASVPACIGIALGSAFGQHLATRLP